MLDSKVYVADSPIHGKGLYAKEFIPAGSVIGNVWGRYTKTDGDHVLWVSDTIGLQVLCQFRYINHSDSPNAAYYDSLEVCAVKDIRPDEEITHNYQEGWDEI